MNPTLVTYNLNKKGVCSYISPQKEELKQIFQDIQNCSSTDISTYYHWPPINTTYK